MKKPFPWKKVLLCAALAALCGGLLVEYGAIIAFFAGVFVLSGLSVFGRGWFKDRRARRDQEEAEAEQEEARREEIARRREFFRTARYAPEERARVVARLEQVLGRPALWDTEEEGLDAALIPPTEALPFWKAATVGAGVYAFPAERVISPYRAELAMALPPDWDPGDRWPVQVLRDAARRFVEVDGFLGPGSLYRGFSLISAGFAEAAAVNGFPGLPDLGGVFSLGDAPLYVFWLIPLLKPEAEYFQARGWPGLERRFPADRPWADPKRVPLADPLTWFEEDIAPFLWSESGELYCLGLELGDWKRELFERAGFSDLAWGWERLARMYLRQYQPEDGPFVDFACEGGRFFAASRDEEIMRRLALGLSDLVRDRPEEARRLLCRDQGWQ